MPSLSDSKDTSLTPQGVRIVHSFEELLDTQFGNGINALCWKRKLSGNFDEIVSRIGEVDEITSIDEDDLLRFDLSEAGAIAREQLLRDFRLLSQAGLDPCLDCIPSYPRSDYTGVIPVDVYSYHADSANCAADTYLCSYTGASSEGIPYHQSILRAEVPEIRAKILEEYGKPEDAGFSDFLREKFYNLHYQPINQSVVPYSFGFGNLWRIATDYPGSPVPPCIHRAPTTSPGQSNRLLLIC
ncbi:hypothetical protein [Pelagicoccus albus]|uniref:DUF1826 domain-containing protein n=1 Tax=Pelagicoccus albus TaxID=415222 RepID=A0A7X1B3I7_9BACT|nr:hypothetical protein [Pelagicoccus albus]MBC2604749.1 hypothetical protein [Pelagicoccus albus]